jgi:hypothetical protein
MPRHIDPLCSFDVPRDWDNKSIIAFSAPARPGAADSLANLVITRDRLRDDEDLVGYAERHLDDLERCMDGFRLVGHKEEQLGDRPALTVSFQSKGGDGLLTQRMTLVELPERLVAAVTCTAPERDLEQMAPLFERILASLRWGP